MPVIKILGCMTPGWYCRWVDAAYGVFKFVSSTSGSSWVFYPMFLGAAMILKAISYCKGGEKIKGITWSEPLMFGTRAASAMRRRRRRIGKRGGSDGTKRIRKSEKSGHIVCKSNVLFETVGRSRIYFGTRRAGRRVEGNNSAWKLELGQSLYPDGRNSSARSD